MKYLLIAIPGAADHPAEEFGGRTPFEVAKIPHLTFFAKMGKVGQVRLATEHLEPLGDTALLNLLGYEAEKVYTGRGPLEAANLELKLEANEIAFRMNFITEAGGVLADPTAGNLSDREAKALINFLNKKLGSEFVRFFPGAAYRHIAVIKDAHGFEALSAKTTSPETIVGERLDSYWPKGAGEELLKKLMSDAKLLLQDHEINQVRLDLKENPANMIWFWGQGRAPQLEKFSDRFGLTGALLADAEYAKGIGRLAGLSVFDTDGLLESEETKYTRIGKLLPASLQEKDFVVLYLDSCSEASRKGDYKAKVSALEAIDFFILSKVREYLETFKEIRILITPCTSFPWKMKKQTRDFVPFLVAGKNIMPDDIERFSEAASKVSSLKISKGIELLKFFISKSQPGQAGTKEAGPG